MPSRPRPDQPERSILRLLERIDRLETMVYGRSSSVTDGRTRFIGDESLIVIGSQLVSGVLRIVGRLILEGLGILTVNGLIELFGSMIVKSGGSIDINGSDGTTRISNSRITFANGSQVRSDIGDGVQLQTGGTKVSVQDGYVQVTIGLRSFIVNSDGHSMPGMLTISITDPDVPAGAFIGAVIAGSSGTLRRVVP
ncbi:hypothetical protein ACYX8G_19700 [Microbacterium saperdae]